MATQMTLDDFIDFLGKTGRKRFELTDHKYIRHSASHACPIEYVYARKMHKSINAVAGLDYWAIYAEKMGMDAEDAYYILYAADNDLMAYTDDVACQEVRAVRAKMVQVLGLTETKEEL